jgi:O-methyltransferase
MKELVQRMLATVGYRLTPLMPCDFSADDVALVQRVRPYTLTSPERIFSCLRAAEYLVSNGVPGDFVECGVWKGGIMMALALTLIKLGDQSRHLCLYDTFEGMASPTDADVDFRGTTAAAQLSESARGPRGKVWAYAPLDEVRSAVLGTGIDPARVHFVKGKVEDTLPGAAPERIGLLRLDTDWYESTRHELEHLYPRLVSGGVIIIDDYGHWQGARKATDEYLARHRIPLLLNRVDYTARIGIKR